MSKEKFLCRFSVPKEGGRVKGRNFLIGFVSLEDFLLIAVNNFQPLTWFFAAIDKAGKLPEQASSTSM